MTVTLRGMAWDHPRARNPLEAIANEWMRTHQSRIEWDARPLKAFEDQPLEELATTYDLVLIDHPFVATAARSGLIAPVDDWTDADYLEDQAAHSVGPSYASYSWDGRQWALAIDAACQVSAVRDDLWSLSQTGAPPDTWARVVEIAGSLRDAKSRVAVPLNENHAYCAFLSVGVSLVGHKFWRPGKALDPAAGVAALELLRRLASVVHPLSREADPIAISDCMSRTDEILYVPLMFGYSSYAREGFRPHRLVFGDAPRGPSGIRGSVLGGVGLSVSARSANRQPAAELARLIASADVQRGVYARSGGQPGHAAAWESSSVNDATHQFFVTTRRTIEQAFVRPRVSGHRPFQPQAGRLIHRFIWAPDGSAQACLQELGRLADELLADWRESP
jgi:multiple sugar transport system substrate-binding protein